jgi:hypothetical protein
VAFTDPQSITISGVTTPLVRILTGTTVGTFRSADGSIELTSIRAALASAAGTWQGST